MKKLIIDVSCDDELKNVVAIDKVTNYLEYYFVAELLTRKGIAVNAKLNTVVQVSITVIEDGLYITSLPPFVCDSDNARIYPVLISIGESIKNAGDLHIQLSLVLFDAMKEFLLENFKKINRKELEEMKLRIDLDYLNKVACAVNGDNSIPLPVLHPEAVNQNIA
ncbi:hypothetical protein [Flavobacterium alkalisoli]|uniref:hypothetical protein n=1 Tax=Flavobacterium alkalisoli TaxID=2602769 RepID=UPI003A8F0E67